MCRLTQMCLNGHKKRFLGSAGCTDSAKTQGKAVKTYDCIYVFDFNFNSGYNLDWNYAF